MTPEQRFDRIEGILERMAVGHEQLIARQEQMTARQEQMTTRQEQMTASQQQITASQQQMTARQQYHDEAFERHDAQIKDLIAAVIADGENIRALARVAEAHQRRIEDLE